MKNRSIIAMKGAPFTRKTEFATLIATSLSCPLLSLEDFLVVMDPDTVHLDLAFKIICEMAKSHLSEKVCDNIVIDSPLSSRFHLGQLVKLVESLEETRLVIIECKPENIYSWQTKFEEYLQMNPHQTHMWYKVKNWDDVDKAIRDDYDETSVYSTKGVSKLKLDPTWDHLPLPKSIFAGLRHTLIRKPKKPVQPSPLMEAIRYMITRHEGDGPDIVVYRQWKYSKDRHVYDTRVYVESLQRTESGSMKIIGNMEINEEQQYCKDGHTITRYMEQGCEVNCMACQNEVKGAAYSCSNCCLAMHKECAESFVNDKRLTHHISYSFPQVFACASCKEDEQPFSTDCMSCLVETNLKCRLMPTVIRHDCEEHFLSIVLLPNDYSYPEGYNCLACGGRVSKMFYSCKICSVYYHVNCLSKIHAQVEDEHGGHHHRMQLKFYSQEAEDYNCDECLERRDPQLWFYSCEDCKYEVHLDCIFQKNDEVRPSRWGSRFYYY